MSASESNVCDIDRSIQMEIHIPTINPNTSSRSVASASASASATATTTSARFRCSTQTNDREKRELRLEVCRHVYRVFGVVSVVIGALFFVVQVIALWFYTAVGVFLTAVGLWSGCLFGVMNGVLALQAIGPNRCTLCWARVTFGFGIASLGVHIALPIISFLELATMNVLYDDYFSELLILFFAVNWPPVFGSTVGLMLVGIDVYYLMHVTKLRTELKSQHFHNCEESLRKSTSTKSKSKSSKLRRLRKSESLSEPQLQAKSNGTPFHAFAINLLKKKKDPQTSSSSNLASDRMRYFRRIAIAKHSMAFIGVCSVITGCWLLVIEIGCNVFEREWFSIGIWAGVLPSVINAANSFHHARAIGLSTTRTSLKACVAIAASTFSLYSICLIVRIFYIVAYSWEEDRKKRVESYHLGLSQAEPSYVMLLMNIPVLIASICVVLHQIVTISALENDCLEWDAESNERNPRYGVAAERSNGRNITMDCNHALLQQIVNENKNNYYHHVWSNDANSETEVFSPYEQTAAVAEFHA